MGHERRVEKVFDGMVVNVYQSLTEAAVESQISLSTLHRYCNEGIKWRFQQEHINNESWKHHPYLDLECSDHGRIKLRSGKITFGSPGKNGYYYVYPTKPRSTRLVSRLIAETFISNPENKPTVDHIDRVKSNNHVTNLRWATMLEQGKNKNPYTTDRKPYPKNRKSRKDNLPIIPMVNSWRGRMSPGASG